jgi:hypothetical protein
MIVSSGDFHIERAPAVRRKMVLKYKEAPHQLSLWRSFGPQQNIQRFQTSAYREGITTEIRHVLASS